VDPRHRRRNLSPPKTGTIRGAPRTPGEPGHRGPQAGIRLGGWSSSRDAERELTASGLRDRAGPPSHAWRGLLDCSGPGVLRPYRRTGDSGRQMRSAVPRTTFPLHQTAAAMDTPDQNGPISVGRRDQQGCHAIQPGSTGSSSGYAQIRGPGYAVRWRGSAPAAPGAPGMRGRPDTTQVPPGQVPACGVTGGAHRHGGGQIQQPPACTATGPWRSARLAAWGRVDRRFGFWGRWS
jgi:hypothetical protein